MKNQEVSRIFREIAKILELKGENIFRIRAYGAQRRVWLVKDDIINCFSFDKLMKWLKK